MPDQIWLLLQWCLETSPDKRPTFSDIVQVLGRCLTDKEVLSREMTKFTSQASSSGNTSNETIMRPPLNTGEFTSYQTPLIPPGTKFDFLNRRMQRNKSIATASTMDTNSPGTGTCSTVTTIVYGSNISNQSNDGGSNTSALNSLHNARSNGQLDGSISPIGNVSRPASAGRRRRDSRLSNADILEDESATAYQERLARQNEQLNAQLSGQLNELHMNAGYRPFIQKISGNSLNRLSEIFRNKDARESASSRDKESKDGRVMKQANSIKNNLLNKLHPKSPDEAGRPIQLVNQTGELSNHREPVVAYKPAANDELILAPNLLKGYPGERTAGSKGSFIQTHNV